LVSATVTTRRWWRGRGFQVAREVAIQGRAGEQIFDFGACDEGAADSRYRHQVGDRTSGNRDAHLPPPLDLA